MNKLQAIVFNIAAISFLVFSPLSHAQTYWCGMTGELIQSKAPCEIPETDNSLQPVKADVVNEEVINATINMIRKAFVGRDIEAIERLTSDDFVFTSNDGSWDGKEIFNTDKKGFLELSTQNLLAMTKYEQDIKEYAIKSIDGDLIAETLSQERVWFGTKQFDVSVLERIKVISVNGLAKIQSLKQIELK